MFGFTLLLLSRFCCFGRVSVQFRVTVTLAAATLDVLTLAFLNCEENTCYDSAYHTEKHTERRHTQMSDRTDHSHRARATTKLRGVTRRASYAVRAA